MLVTCLSSSCRTIGMYVCSLLCRVGDDGCRPDAGPNSIQFSPNSFNSAAAQTVKRPGMYCKPGKAEPVSISFACVGQMFESRRRKSVPMYVHVLDSQ